jgi:ribosomal protein S18 acetylase RimI-like enzyme
MPRPGPQGLVKVQALEPHIDAEIQVLREVCREHEPQELPLHLEPGRAVPGNETNPFLYYDEGQLVGCVSLQPIDGIELVGMVHPQYRRRGIGRALLEAARDECRLRGAEVFLLVCEETSPSGKAFADAVGGQYRFSEYRMELDPATIQRSSRRPEAIRLERAGAEDLETLWHIRTASSGHENSAQQQIADWFRSPDQRFYIGRRGGDAVGSLRVFMIGQTSTVYIHSFSVVPECRRRGYGREILEKSIDALRAEGWQHIRIEVETENRAALGLYRSCGFREIAQFRYYEMCV